VNLRFAERSAAVVAGSRFLRNRITLPAGRLYEELRMASNGEEFADLRTRAGEQKLLRDIAQAMHHILPGNRVEPGLDSDGRDET
jgi:hypothetical protein